MRGSCIAYHVLHLQALFVEGFVSSINFRCNFLNDDVRHLLMYIISGRWVYTHMVILRKVFYIQQKHIPLSGIILV